MKRWLRANALRLIGLVLLVVLVIQLKPASILEKVAAADFRLVAISALGMIPLILVKTIRWQRILRAQNAVYALWPAYLAYFGSIFIGFLTPGRLGEFIKAVHVSRDCGVSTALGFSSVLADRLFDLYVVVIVGGLGLIELTTAANAVVSTGLIFAITLIPLFLFLNDRWFAWFTQQAGRIRFIKIAKYMATLEEIRVGLKALTWKDFLVTVAYTVVAYAIFFGQCYLLTIALNLNIDLRTTMFAVAIGSLVTLLPLSIAGLGTREAATVAFLASHGVAPEQAISFSLLVFLACYVAGGLIGALAWFAKPAPLAWKQNVAEGGTP